MGRPPASTDSALEQALTAVASARDVDELRSAQAVLLPLLGFSLEQAGKVIGRDRYWVSRARSRALRGESPPAPHGGRRRSTLTEDAEGQLVKQAIRELAFGQATSLRQKVWSLMNERATKPVAESTVDSLLGRVAPKIMPGWSSTQLQSIAPALGRQWHYTDLVARLLHDLAP